MDERTKVLVDHVARSFAEEVRKMRASIDQRMAEAEQATDRRLNEIENAMLRSYRRAVKEMREENIDKAVELAARRKRNGSGAHP
ncbi:hypothetical protein [Mesorhizobium sp. M00.F.Ca.ET.216.01.1.1]|uniref:hypothetical protein n=1 Tax=Mesorhizobium sp. M00.F.Ca.ET.216.01.1.1 TaxID=2500528 RepID=UPI000FDB537A|nr:hypothetical protein [Mesorhizobium sp. M00.F.Ca.ET.216.01.1.1]TGQ41175.1 hypothetical protein EN859_012545 [Mesorhizobium sp. M00.F.Ca.ET.216.01.1.1]